MRVDGFWMGAIGASRVVDVVDLAHRAGGWQHLANCTCHQLIQLGLSPNVARSWLRAPSFVTSGKALRWVDDEYPEMLRELPHAPPVLFIQGDPQALSSPAVAIVGTRTCTSYGLAVARDLAAAVSEAGHVVVSGLARGIDAAAHRGTLGRGRTIAVLAHGLSFTAPASHRSLRRSLLDEGGAVVTTWPDGVPPRRWAFPMRNRWIAGLADKVVVVEAGLRSGASHTASAAADYSRTLYAVPGPLGAPASAGCNRLIRDGALSLLSVAEFVSDLGSMAARTPWLDQLLSGATLECVALTRGISVLELLVEVQVLEAQGILQRMPGQRYGRGSVRAMS